MITVLLSATTIKQIVPEINNEIDNTIIDNATRLVQGTLLKDTLTQDFYDDFYTKYCASILSGGTPLSTAYQYLKDNYLDYILAYGVWEHLVITLSYQLNSAGLRLKVTDHSTIAEATDITFMRKYIENFIDAKRKEMSRYIFDNQTNYPLYYSDKWGDMPKKANFRIGRVGGGTSEPDCPYWRTVR